MVVVRRFVRRWFILSRWWVCRKGWLKAVVGRWGYLSSWGSGSMAARGVRGVLGGRSLSLDYLVARVSKKGGVDT